MSRPNVTVKIGFARFVDGLGFARACVLDQRSASHARKEHSWDARYQEALTAIDTIVAWHKRVSKKKVGAK